MYLTYRAFNIIKMRNYYVSINVQKALEMNGKCIINAYKNDSYIRKNPNKFSFVFLWIIMKFILFINSVIL